MAATRWQRLCEIAVVIIILLVLIAMLLPSVQHTRHSSSAIHRRNLMQIALALHNYASGNQAFPLRAIRSADGKPLLSWRVALLPYLEEGATVPGLYEQFHLDEAWDSEHNLALVNQMPAVFERRLQTAAEGATHYLGVVGPGAVFGAEEGVALSDITDGLSNTIMVVEADRAVPWTKPEDLNVDLDNPLQELGGLHPRGFFVLLSDGGVKFILNTIDSKTLRGLMTIDGGESVSVP